MESFNDSKDRDTKRYLALITVGFLPSLAGCLSEFHIKGEADGYAEPRDNREAPSELPRQEESEEFRADDVYTEALRKKVLLAQELMAKD